MIRRIFFVGLASLLLGGCGLAAGPVAVSFTREATSTAQEVPVRVTQTKLPAYASRRMYREPATGTESSMLVLALAKDGWQWNLLEDRASLKSPAGWRMSASSTLAINGVYFTETRMPSGYLETVSATYTTPRPWPSAQARADVHGYTAGILVDKTSLSLAYLPRDPVDPRTHDAVALTFPTLVLDGKALVEKESGLRSQRTVLATDRAGNVYAIVTEWGTLSLYELSHWLAEQPEKFVRAANLDGGPSTGLSLKDGDFVIDTGFTPVPNAFVATRVK